MKSQWDIVHDACETCASGPRVGAFETSRLRYNGGCDEGKTIVGGGYSSGATRLPYPPLALAEESTVSR